MDYLKVNIDGDFDDSMKCGGWGLCITDCQGEVLGAWRGHLLNLQAAFHAGSLKPWLASRRVRR